MVDFFTPMTAKEYKTLREQLKISNYALAPRLGIGLRQAQRYEADDVPIMRPVAFLLRMYASHGIPPYPKTKKPARGR